MISCDEGAGVTHPWGGLGDACWPCWSLASHVVGGRSAGLYEVGISRLQKGLLVYVAGRWMMGRIVLGGCMYRMAKRLEAAGCQWLDVGATRLGLQLDEAKALTKTGMKA